jgi:hypothetical protein
VCLASRAALRRGPVSLSGVGLDVTFNLGPTVPALPSSPISRRLEDRLPTSVGQYSGTQKGAGIPDLVRLSHRTSWSPMRRSGQFGSYDNACIRAAVVIHRSSAMRRPSRGAGTMHGSAGG